MDKLSEIKNIHSLWVRKWIHSPKAMSMIHDILNSKEIKGYDCKLIDVKTKEIICENFKVELIYN